MVEPTLHWRYPDPEPPGPEYLGAVAAHGGGERLARVLARRGVQVLDLEGFFGPAAAGLHDPALLPDAERAVNRFALARRRGEGVLVVGDFDADGLTALAILVRALHDLGLDVSWHVPSRAGDGHGLSARSVELARAAGRTLVVTVDTGTSSAPEIEAAAALGIDVIVTDHHRVPPALPPAVAVVNPQRRDAAYPDRRLSGAGVAFRLAVLLAERLGGSREAADGLADLAIIGTVADVAPVLGENRAIARMGLEQLRVEPRPGLAALLAVAGIAPAAVSLETIAYTIAPRLNAAGRVGDADDAAALLLEDDPGRATELAARLEEANLARRELTRTALDEARSRLAADPPADADPAFVRGTWPVGVIGLVAGRLAEERARPAIVATELDGLLRASCRAGDGVDLAAALEGCADILVRHGGHRSAAGFEIEVARWDEARARLAAVLGGVGPGTGPMLEVDLALPPREVDYGLLAELAALEPTGPGNPPPVIAVHGLTVTRIRAANGGHAQLTLRREVDVVDAIAFGRADLVDRLHSGDRVDVAARLASRRFGGFESLQLEILDVASAGEIAAVRAPGARTALPVGVGP
jgi:single-stranded-DNA-specific exonuclease